jgi:hypothetical protein
MAKGKGKATVKAKAAVRAASVDGVYRFRFAGFSRGPGDYPFTVNGVGYIELMNGKDAEGVQWSASMPMTGVNGAFKSSKWKLSGTYLLDNGTGVVTIKMYFTRDGEADPLMYDVFQMVPGRGNDGFWFISMGPKDMNDNPLDESVSGEAVKA